MPSLVFVRKGGHKRKQSKRNGRFWSVYVDDCDYHLGFHLSFALTMLLSCVWVFVLANRNRRRILMLPAIINAFVSTHKIASKSKLAMNISFWEIWWKKWKVKVIAFRFHGKFKEFMVSIKKDGAQQNIHLVPAEVLSMSILLKFASCWRRRACRILLLSYSAHVSTILIFAPSTIFLLVNFYQKFPRSNGAQWSALLPVRIDKLFARERFACWVSPDFPSVHVSAWLCQ